MTMKLLDDLHLLAATESKPARAAIILAAIAHIRTLEERGPQA